MARDKDRKEIEIEVEGTPETEATAATEDTLLSPEDQLKEKKKEELKIKRAEAKSVLKEMLKAEYNGKDEMVILKEAFEQIRSAIKTLVSFGTARTSTGSKVSKTDVLKEMIKKDGQIEEMKIFEMFQIGRPEMAIQRRLMIQKCDAEDRVYMNFDEDKRAYVLVSVGAEVPADWEGYIPDDQKEDF